MENELAHLKHHVDYPATTAQINAACNNMSDVPENDRTWFKSSLPEGNYKNPDEVVSALLKRV